MSGKWTDFMTRVLLSGTANLSDPCHMEFALTTHYNLACRACGMGKASDRTSELTSEEIMKIIAGAQSIRWLTLAGGEIFVLPNIGQIMERAAGMETLSLINFTTNGFLSDRIESTVKSTLKNAQVAVFAAIDLVGPKDAHNTVRGNLASWDRALETYDRLRRLHHEQFRVCLCMTVQEENKKLFEQTVKAVNAAIGNVSTRDVHVRIVRPTAYGNRTGHCTQLPHPLSDDEIVALTKKKKALSRARFAAAENIYSENVGKPLSATRGSSPCRAAEASLFVDARGNAYPCVSDNRSFGNLRDFGYDLTRLWHAPQREEIRKTISQENCARCWTP